MNSQNIKDKIPKTPITIYRIFKVTAGTSCTSGQIITARNSANPTNPKIVMRANTQYANPGARYIPPMSKNTPRTSENTSKSIHLISLNISLSLIVIASLTLVLFKLFSIYNYKTTIRI